MAPQDEVQGKILHSVGCQATQLHSASSGPESSFRKNNRPGWPGMNVEGIQGVGSCRSVIHSDRPCHCIPRPNVPSAPPMILSQPKNRPGPTVLAKAGTCVVRLLKLVSAFCSIVNGCSLAPSRWVCFFQSPTDANSAAKCGSQNAMWQTRPIQHMSARASSWRRNAVF